MSDSMAANGDVDERVNIILDWKNQTNHVNMESCEAELDVLLHYKV